MTATIQPSRLELCIRIATKKLLGRICGFVLLLPVLGFLLFACTYRAWKAFVEEFRYQYQSRDAIGVNNIMVGIAYLAVCGKRIGKRKRRTHG